MSNENDLFTDYALQFFSSYMMHDLSTINTLLQSFKSEGKDGDIFFLPGVIYGLMFHMSALIDYISEQTGADVSSVLSSYSLNYAMLREELMDNPLLNVAYVRNNMEKIMQDYDDISSSLNDEDDLF